MSVAVEYEKSPMRLAVDLLVMNADQDILLGYRKSSTGENMWALPGGHVELGERLEEAGARELVEELGTEAVIELTNMVVGVRQSCLSPSFEPHLTIILLAKYVQGQIFVVEPNKCSEWKFFSPSKLPATLFSGSEESISSFLGKKPIVVTQWQDHK